MAAIVPQTVITTAIKSRAPSFHLHFRSSAIFADTGPITQSKNAENAPTNAIIELNSGKKIETATAEHVKAVRSRNKTSPFVIPDCFV